ncbi:Hypothetical predicted protein [Cloeon dipterum]|uniref:DUF4806 domain-containing protein n=1 Tax=Cloeon dipterum TaxID=197152 RepID=A0A8S1CED4_9INSE|nr:Hypothetical predicted protein [Cloeon dipterum]
MQITFERLIDLGLDFEASIEYARGDELVAQEKIRDLRLKRKNLELGKQERGTQTDESPAKETNTNRTSIVQIIDLSEDDAAFPNDETINENSNIPGSSQRSEGTTDREHRQIRRQTTTDPAPAIQELVQPLSRDIEPSPADIDSSSEEENDDLFPITDPIENHGGDFDKLKSDLLAGLKRCRTEDELNDFMQRDFVSITKGVPQEEMESLHDCYPEVKIRALDKKRISAMVLCSQKNNAVLYRKCCRELFYCFLTKEEIVSLTAAGSGNHKAVDKNLLNAMHAFLMSFGRFNCKLQRITDIFNNVKKNVITTMKYKTDSEFREKQKKSAIESNRKRREATRRAREQSARPKN